MPLKTRGRRSSFPGSEKEKEQHQDTDDSGSDGDGVEDGDHAAQA